MYTSVDAHGWGGHQGSSGDRGVAGVWDAGFYAELRSLREGRFKQELQPTRVRNFLIKRSAGSHTAPGVPVLVRSLRVTVEEFDGDGLIAFLTADRSFAAHGDSLSGAVAGLMEMLVHDYQFYQSTPENELTKDASACKAMLQKLFTTQG